MEVKVVTDSTADLPQALVKELDITVVPLTVHFGEEVYLDGVEMKAEEFYRRLASAPALPRTSQPPAGAFAQAYKELARKADILSIHISSRLSGTYNAALQGREAVGLGERVEIIDSLSASVGVGLVALAAARAARSGASLEVASREARRAIPRVKLACLLDTLEYLRKGGRIGKAQALLGSLLQVKPIITLRDGETYPLERARTWGRGKERLLGLVMAHGPVAEAAIAYTTNREEAQTLARQLGLPGERVVISQFGPVLGTYVGPGALGVAWREAG